MVQRVAASVFLLLFLVATTASGMPARCLLDTHCAGCEEIAGPSVGEGCLQMAPAAPAVADGSQLRPGILVPPAISSLPIPAFFHVALRVNPGVHVPLAGAAPPGGLALRI